MISVRELLNHVWSVFRTVGIADDLTIIGYIAALLLKNKDLRLDKTPEMPPASLDSNIKIIQRLLSEAANLPEVGGTAKLFDRYILFRLPRMLPGGRYPTPRHIVESMLHLLQVEPNHSLGDFACGSGGFLVRRPVAGQPHECLTIGVDISPEWTKIALANAALHGLSSFIRVEAYNSLQGFLFDKEVSKIKFDRIVSNSPFGEKIDEQLAVIALNENFGGRSETALTALALQKLAQEGKAALLVPSGLLFSSSKGERKLRQQIVDDHQLLAVIALPKEALQPYSQLQTNLLLVCNKPPTKESLTWFWQVEQDGYPAGRSRDLTKEPLKPNDLTFVEEVLTNCNTNLDIVLPEQTNPQVRIRKIIYEDNLLGLVCEGVSQELTSVDLYLPPNKTATTFVLVEIGISIQEQRICLCVPLDGGEPSVVENKLQLIQELYKPKPQDPNPGIRLLSQPVQAVAIAVFSDKQALDFNKPRLLGVAVHKSAIKSPVYDLHPEHYIGKQDEYNFINSPAELLTKIYKNQRKLSQHIDSLFSRLELPSIADPKQKIPSQLVEIEPFGTLSKEQKQVWEQIRQESELIVNNDDLAQYQTAVHFSREKLGTISTEEVSDSTGLTLELLERMGVIVPVTLLDPNTNEPVALYRRVTERDLWLLTAEKSDVQEEGQ